MVDYVGRLSSHVENLRELARIAHDHRALLVTDMLHAVEVMPVDVKKLDVDILITGSYKWLMSIRRAALAYIRGELLESLNHPMPGGWGLDFTDTYCLVRKVLGLHHVLGQCPS